MSFAFDKLENLVDDPNTLGREGLPQLALIKYNFRENEIVNLGIYKLQKSRRRKK